MSYSSCPSSSEKKHNEANIQSHEAWKFHPGWWFQPIWKILVPQVGVKIKNIWNHHLASESTYIWDTFKGVSIGSLPTNMLKIWVPHLPHVFFAPPGNYIYKRPQFRGHLQSLNANQRQNLGRVTEKMSLTSLKPKNNGLKQSINV